MVEKKWSSSIFDLILKHASAGIVVLDKESKLLAVSQHFLELSGLKGNDVIGKTLKELFVNDIPESLAKAYDSSLKGLPECRNEEMFTFSDGRQEWFSWKMQPWYDDEGNMGGVLFFTDTITKEKKIEEELKKTVDEMLSLSQIVFAIGITNFKKMLETILYEISNITDLEGGIICMVTEDGRLTLAAHRGTTKETIKDLTENVIKIGDCLCGNCAKDGKPLILRNEQEVLKFATREAQRGEGIKFYAAFPLIVKNRCIGVLCVFTRTEKKLPERIISLLETFSSLIAIAIENAKLVEEAKSYSTELENKVSQRTKELTESYRVLKNLVEELNEKSRILEEANEKLIELDRLKSMFIASMSHELRTPLNSIIGFSSIMLNEWIGPVNDEQKKNLETILRAGKHLLSLINDIIDVSKIESGLLDVNISDFDLNDVMTEVITSFGDEFTKKGLELKFKPLHVVMHTDKRRLTQVILNLVSNALKYTEKGNVSVDVNLVGDRVEITVADTGIGIKAKDIKDLFKPFVRFESPLKALTPGTGLGLYLTKKLLTDVLKGDISVETEFGKGSIFKVLVSTQI